MQEERIMDCHFCEYPIKVKKSGEIVSCPSCGVTYKIIGVEVPEIFKKPGSPTSELGGIPIKFPEGFKYPKKYYQIPKPGEHKGNPETRLEPWQMTQAEYSQWANSLEKRYNEILGKPVDPQSPVGRAAEQRAFGQLKKETGLTQLTFTDMAGMGHKAKVRLALQEGKPVPPEVLKDYPDLKPGNPSSSNKMTLDEAKLKDTYDWLKAKEAEGGVGVLGSWSGFRHQIYNREVLKITPEELAKIPHHKRELPPTTWDIPPEYMVAFLRVGRKMSKADAVKEVEEKYLPRLKEETRSPKSNPGDERLLKVAIEREPLRVAKQWGYEVHRLSPKDIIDKEDYARGYRYRLSKADPTQPYPRIVMARSEGEVATFLKRQIEGNPKFEEPDLAAAQMAEIEAISKKYLSDMEALGPLGSFLERQAITDKYTTEIKALKQRILKGDNPMPRTESERLSFHERIFGKGSTPPLERLGRGQTVNDMLPMPPDQGPPLPRVLELRWPWKK